MGNLDVLFSGPSHLYEFCINQRLKDRTPQTGPQSGSESQTLRIQAPLLLRVSVSSPCDSLLCVSQHNSTQPSLTPGLRLSSSGRILIFCGMWLQTLCWFLLLVLHGFQEELWTFSWIVNIPKKSGVPGGWISASDGHGSLFWKSHLAT